MLQMQAITIPVNFTIFVATEIFMWHCAAVELAVKRFKAKKAQDLFNGYR